MISRDLRICEKCQLNTDMRVFNPCMMGQYSQPEKHRINKQCDVMVVVEAPDELDEKRNIIVSEDKIGVLLRNAISGCGVTDYYMTYIVKCKSLHPKGKETQPPTPAIIKACNPYFKAEIGIIKPKYVLVMGNPAMVGALKKSGIGKWHGSPMKEEGVVYLATYNPMSLTYNKKNVTPFFEDLKIFKTLIEEQGDETKIKMQTTYNYVNNKQLLIAMIKDLYDKKVFAFDIESPSVNPWKHTPYFKDAPAVACISFSTTPGTAWVLPVDHPDTPFSPPEKEEIKKILKAVMEDETLLKIAHNAKFDIEYMRVVLGIVVKGLIFDTMLASFLLNEEGGEHGLKDLALRFTDLGDYEESLAKERKKVKPKSEEYNYMRMPMLLLFPYAACDADATIRLYYFFKKLLEEEELLGAMEMLIEMSESLTQVEVNGAKIDVDYVLKVEKEYIQMIDTQKVYMRTLPEIQDIEEYYTYRNAFAWLQIAYAHDQEKRKLQAPLFDTLPEKILDMPIGDFFRKFDSYPFKNKLTLYKKMHSSYPFLFRPLKKEYFNFNSTYCLQDLIYGYLAEPVYKKTESGAPSTDESVIKALADKYPIMTELNKYKKLIKFYSTYINPVVPEWMCEDGLIHTSYKIHGTATGRLSSVRPNMQNLPRDDKVVKNMFMSRFENGYIINADYSQIELRILAVYSKDEKLIAFYNSGKDLHTQTAATILGLPFEQVTEAQRQVFKSINFLIIYGGTAKALATKTGITEQDAEGFMEQYFKTFPGVVTYMTDYQNMASKYKFIRTLTGRKRRLPNVDSSKPFIKEEALRMAINTPIQSTASDITQNSLYRVQKVFKKMGLRSMVVCTVHDSIVFDVHPDEVLIVYKIIKTVLENPPHAFCRNKEGEYIVPYKCDIQIGRRYGSVKDLVLEDNTLFVITKKKEIVNNEEVTVKVKTPFKEFQM